MPDRPKPGILIQARGFTLGGAGAVELGAGFVPARKPGKLLWWELVRRDYEPEYGSDAPARAVVRV